MGALIDLTGRRFGRLTVLRRAASHGSQVHWVCACDCGATVSAPEVLAQRAVAFADALLVELGK